eukprot:2371465-Amphidinium_carterae.1
MQAISSSLLSEPTPFPCNARQYNVGGGGGAGKFCKLQCAVCLLTSLLSSGALPSHKCGNPHRRGDGHPMVRIQHNDSIVS